ncbi:MAG: Uma2 family endonuclease [Saprospiraceae bacterium]|nr:Uma2 family endonuclease [Saprospiraceae bacterium]
MNFQDNTQQNPQIEERKYTISEYFDLEIRSDKRHEFYNGTIVECAYTSENHGTVVHNLNFLLGQCLRKTDCKVFAENRMLYSKYCNRVYYPDILVACSEIDYYQYSKNQVAIINPSVLIEVLSDSTENIDRGDKLKCYRKIPSLKQYIIVEQDSKNVQVYEYDTAAKRWIAKVYEEDGDTVKIGDCDIPLDEIYLKVDLIQPNQQSDN